MSMSQTTPISLQPPQADGSVPPRVVELRDAAVELGGRTIWSQASFTVESGEFITVLGPNGAGKSTLLKVVLGLLRPSAGEVRVFGRAPRRGRAEIGYVPQRRTIESDLNVRGRDFVQLGLDGYRWGFALPIPGRHEARDRVQEAIVSVEATPYADRPIGQLSGGEQQRLLLAQALVGNPRLLLLDEPLASLDLRNQQAISQLVARLARERSMTVMLVSHDLNPLLGLVDRLVYVARGKVVSGTPDTILTTENLTRLYNSPVEVLRDSQGHVFVVGLDAEGHLP
ncbi:MAG: metal ABC transporter ATP-binding protein [Ktedonobacterales bacterium]